MHFCLVNKVRSSLETVDVKTSRRLSQSKSDARSKILQLVLAGGQGGRLDLLTEQRAKPAISFVETLRLIDFSMSNCHHSHLSDV
ncbi:unnamed protein product [Rotaria sp. Silwood2]|nr:unnamed protein product [Rotaria sp. Silwood2]CAF2530993.1 unnamed protein product [Rotaria sp. Silwood2]CAF3383820.1 unnamed protein product [Rotaria sp. Silwood2]CAF3494616.1 unnamed protein product [Rotaria sp. Silwood2]CAF4066170.1 unnamed protein product [Rotaria sp. Silwood2]